MNECWWEEQAVKDKEKVHQKKTGHELKKTKKQNVLSTYVLVDRFYIALFSAHEQTHIACM